MIPLLIAALIFTADWLIKNHTDKILRDGAAREVAKDRIILRKFRNQGIALGFLKGESEKILELMRITLVGVFGSLLYQMRNGGGKLSQIGYGLILGGGLNNLLDREKNGYVRDYFSFNVKWDRLRKLVFNLSDFAVMIGMALVVMGKFRDRRK